ncbi:hypothetical protein SLA2020_198670 [Shorea laevis]
MALVAISLIVTVRYQAVVSPPEGVWQGDPSLLLQNQSDNNNTKYTASSSTNAKKLKAIGKTVMPKCTGLVFSVLNTAAFISLLQVARSLLFLHTGQASTWMVYILLLRDCILCDWTTW